MHANLLRMAISGRHVTLVAELAVVQSRPAKSEERDISIYIHRERKETRV